MAWTELFNEMAFNLGMALPDLILVVLSLGAIILFAKDLKVGLVSLFMLYAMLFILYAGIGWDITHVIIAFFISLALMTISLYTSSGKSMIN